MRVTLTPPTPSPTALAELKQWLGITTGTDDAPLATLLAAALDTCEAFTGVRPIEAECEELLPACAGWQQLATRPVMAITSLEAIATDGTRTPLAADGWEADLGAEGSGRVRLPRLSTLSGTTGRVAVRFTAGLSPGWDALPEALRHGIVRLAAHQHRARDDGSAAPLPPASVAALWRPWRRMRLK